MEQTLAKEYGNIDQTGQEFLTFSNEIIRNVQKYIYLTLQAAPNMEN